MSTLNLDIIRGIVKSISYTPIKEHTVVMNRDIMTMYDKDRPWFSVHEHITNTKRCSNGIKRGGVRYILAEEMYHDYPTD